MTSTPSACERLAQSRERLRQAMRDVGSPPKEHNHQRPGQATPFTSDWLTQLKTVPGANLLVEIFQDWWAKQPLHLTLTQVAEAVKLVLQPVAQRHPYALVLGAAVAGGLLVLARPWRWISTPALMAGLLPTLVAEIMKFMPDQARATPSTDP
jgi:hypothetical protein